MRLGFVVNDVKTEEAGYTTSRMATTAINRGHEVWIMAVGDLAYDPDERIRAWARRAPKERYKNSESYLRDLQSRSTSISERITGDDLDVLMLRNDPAQDVIARPWASTAAIVFGRVALRHGVIVLNDPNGLAKAVNKMYFQTFPEEVRPRTLITRDREKIKEFAREEAGTIVLKPLAGSGGAGVFLVRPEDIPNLNQMIDAVSRDGYVVCQEYLPAAAEGDMRSNIHAGGSLRQATIGDEALRLAEMCRPKLVQDGMFLVGLDIVGDKLMEINVFSPGGLGSAQKFEGVNFNRAVVDALERKVQYMQYYRRNFDNVELAAL